MHWKFVIKATIVFFAILGVALSFLPAIHLLTGLIPTDVELPLGGLTGIAIGDGDLIFCDSEVYLRIQIYSSEGQFIKAINLPDKYYGWYVDNSRWVLCVGGHNSVLIYSLDGELLSDIDRAREQWAKFDGLPGRIATDSRGNLYRIALNSQIFPQVVRTFSTGGRETVVSQAWYLWVIKHPHPASWYLALGILGVWIYAAVEWIRKRKRQEQVKEG